MRLDTLHSCIYSAAAECSIVRLGAVAAKQRLTVNLEAPEYQELQRLAKQHNVSMAWLGRRAIAWFLEQDNSQRKLPFPLNVSGEV